MSTKLKLAAIPKYAYGGITNYDTKPVKTLQEQQAAYNASLEDQQKTKANSEGIVNSGLAAAGTFGGAWGQAAALSHTGGTMIQNAIAPKDEYGVANNDTGVAVGQVFSPTNTIVGGVQKMFKGQVARGLIDTFLAPIGAGLDNRDARRARDEEQDRETKLEEYQRSMAQISNYPVYGNRDVSYYHRMGGRIPCYDAGGKLLPIGSGAKEVVGNTHEQGGVNLLRGGKPVANVEDEEVLYGDKVYSARLLYRDGKTYADAAKLMAATGNKDGLERLFALQEASKPKESPRKEMATGGTLANNEDDIYNYTGLIENNPNNDPSYFSPMVGSGDSPYNPTYASYLKQVTHDPTVSTTAPTNQLATKQPIDYRNNAAMIAPYIRGGVNAIINNNRPRVPNARMEVPANLSTNYDINPALANIERQQIASNIDINNNSASSVDARNTKLFNQSNAIDKKNQLYLAKTNTETELKNNKATSDANTANHNLAKLDNTDAMRFAAQVEKQNANSENFSDTTDTYLNQNKENNQFKLDQSRIQLTSQALAIDNPAGLRQGISSPVFRAAWKTAGKQDELKEKMSTEQASVDEWNKYNPENPTSLGWKRGK